MCLIIANKGFEARRKQMSQWCNQDERSGARCNTPFSQHKNFLINNQSIHNLNGMPHFLKILNEINNNLFFKTSQNTSQRNSIQNLNNFGTKAPT